MKIFSAVLIASVITIAVASEAKAGCGFGDPFCNPSQWTCPPGGCNNRPRPNSGSTIPSDMTPPRVRRAYDLQAQGYVCREVEEYPLWTCIRPQGMAEGQFRYELRRHDALDSSSRQWVWNCLNSGGQAWIKPTGATTVHMICEPNMR